MIQIVKSFRVGVWGRPFFKRVSPSESKQSRSTPIELTLIIKDENNLCYSAYSQP